MMSELELLRVVAEAAKVLLRAVDVEGEYGYRIIPLWAEEDLTAALDALDDAAPPTPDAPPAYRVGQRVVLGADVSVVGVVTDWGNSEFMVRWVGGREICYPAAAWQDGIYPKGGTWIGRGCPACGKGWTYEAHEAVVCPHCGWTDSSAPTDPAAPSTQPSPNSHRHGRNRGPRAGEE